MKKESFGNSPSNTGYQFRGDISALGTIGYGYGGPGSVYMDESAEELPKMLVNEVDGSNRKKRSVAISSTLVLFYFKLLHLL